MRPKLTSGLSCLSVCASVLLSACLTTYALADDVALKKHNQDAQKAYVARDYPTAEAEYLLALKEATVSPAKVRIILLSNLGATYREQHKYPEAEKSFKQALMLGEKGNLNRDQTLLHAMQQYAALLRKMKRLDDADAMDAKVAGPVAAAVPSFAGGTGFQTPMGTYSGQGSPYASSGAGSQINAIPNPANFDYEHSSIDDIKNAITTKGADPVLWINLGVKYEAAENLQLAASAYQRGIELASAEQLKTLQGHERLAMLHAKTNNFIEAVSEAKKALAGSPDDPNSYRRLSSYCSSAGDMQGAIDANLAYLDKFPGAADAATVVSFVNYQKSELAKGPAKAVSEVSRMTWSLTAMPLKVYINDRYGEVAFSPSTSSKRDAVLEGSASDILRRAMDSWSQASASKCQFMIVDSPDKANIEVVFTDDKGGMENDYTQGVTTFPSRSGETKCHIRLLTLSASNGKPLTKAEFLEAALHEFGHALGLVNHSQTPTDVMYYSVHSIPMVALSSHDTERIQAIYNNRGY